MAQRKATLKKRQKELILRALTDPKFRRALADNPTETLGKRRLRAENEKELRLILATVKAIEVQISALADELLCANGGPCGIA